MKTRQTLQSKHFIYNVPFVPFISIRKYVMKFRVD